MSTLEHRFKLDDEDGEFSGESDAISHHGKNPKEVLREFYPDCVMQPYDDRALPKSTRKGMEYCPTWRVGVRGEDRSSIIQDRGTLIEIPDKL